LIADRYSPDHFKHAETRLKRNPWSAWLLPCAYVIGVSALLYFLLLDWAYDDPFITYRYAQNLAHGSGFVYNLNELVLSTTTPLFTLLLAFLSPAFPSIPHIANLIGAISLALGALFLWDLAQIWGTPEVGWAALLLYPTLTLPATTVGSETPLYIALCLGTFTLYARQRYTPAAIAAALACLARPDGVLVVVVIAADFLLRSKPFSPRGAGAPHREKIPWKAVLIFLCLFLSWYVFAWFYFGFPLPVTLAAKQQQSTLVVSQHFLRGFLWILSWYITGWQYWIEAILAVLGAVWLWVQARAWLLLLAWTGLYFAAYTLLQVPRYFWYYAPLVPGFIALVGLGAAAVAHMVRHGSWNLARNNKNQEIAPGRPLIAEEPKTRARLANIVTLTILVSITTAQVADLWKMKENPDRRAAAYRAVGSWLRENTPADAVIGSLEVGVIGYYAERRMVDFAGLIQPEVAIQLGRSQSYDEAAAWTMENYRPDYVVLVKGDLRSFRQDYLEEHCQIMQRFPEEISGYTAINVYTCP
jgi:hypothetical protein